MTTDAGHGRSPHAPHMSCNSSTSRSRSSRCANNSPGRNPHRCNAPRPPSSGRGSRRVGHDADADADELFPEAIAQLRELSTPYHLAHGLLDHAEHLLGHGDGHGDTATATDAISEATAIADRLGCAPVHARADQLRRAHADADR